MKSETVSHSQTVDPTSAVRQPGQLYVIKREGQIVPYDDSKIAVAVTKAMLAALKDSPQTMTQDASYVHDVVKSLTEGITHTFKKRWKTGGVIHIESIQDQVELTLMRFDFPGAHTVARAYVLYREERRKARAEKTRQQARTAETVPAKPTIRVVLNTGEKTHTTALDALGLQALLTAVCAPFSEQICAQTVYDETQRGLFDGISEKEVYKALILTARAGIEKDPAYNYVTARLLLAALHIEALRFLGLDALLATAKDSQKKHTAALPYRGYISESAYPRIFVATLKKGVALGLLNPTLLTTFDLDTLGEYLTPQRDQLFKYLGIQTLYDRYFLHAKQQRFELPQIFFMRVAMGLALNEKPAERTQWAMRFYDVLSSLDAMSSTPTLFNAGTCHSQLASCFLSTVPDDLESIFSIGIKDSALLSKYAGGIGADWTPVRSADSPIKGTNGISSGLVPFIRVFNDTMVAVNQGGKRNGSGACYLETWHGDMEAFLELRKNTGDERRRAHDINTANWIPDLFMKRVHEKGNWTLFSPSDAPDLHDLYGDAFDKTYLHYEKRVAAGQMSGKVLPAVTLWRKMLSMLFETGHPWMTFKDAINVRSAQKHVGVVHSSNLCTEIVLPTSKEEIAVCNLLSINLCHHMTKTGLDKAKLQKTIRIAMRMLDNVIDINYYPVPQAAHSNKQHRPVGLGLMGFQDVLHALSIPYASEKAVDFADTSMEIISYYAIEASTQLAEERGTYPTYEGSLWSQGILPIDTIETLSRSRGEAYLQMDTRMQLDWAPLRQRIQTAKGGPGVRFSFHLAIAPTATISNICGVSQSIEPTYQNLFVKSNLSGEFTVLNESLVTHLKKAGVWDEAMLNDLKYYNGSVQKIKRVPEAIKAIYLTAFEIEAKWLVQAASRRQKWIDQALSLNLYLASASGKKLDNLYRYAWLSGLKTTYYLRTLGATDAEKVTHHTGQLNAVKTKSHYTQSDVNDTGCEACQ